MIGLWKNGKKIENFTTDEAYSIKDNKFTPEIKEKAAAAGLGSNLFAT